ncbi:transcriptional regulator [Cordyceps militaris CM01]|uniref:Transcriptional regulator n=1 Tax=Cordyceps militaris (strain CM01) TaxID=983644 RepID=G3JAC7_CORMM|nr:transcriptional regulator [Cordyceps militaris CM01]EGX95095.1 transcriptional regulator [Cordyceps militaris CM01]
MAPPSPRRSSRARAAHPQSQQSSSGVSSRSERNTRSIHRPSSDKSTPSASLSSEPLEDSEDGPMPRRRRRGLDDDPDKMLQSDILDRMTNASDDMQDEEDEAVRCICGSEDYPGRPLVDGPDAEIFASVDLTAEDVTGFFVQCDICKVWQHGACVGIFSAESSPDEYFCEQCRQDFHQITVANNGPIKEKSEKDERERQRQESANKRKNRAERRRAEDSDVSEEMPIATTKLEAPKASEPSSASEPTPTVANAPGTPPPTSVLIGSSHKRPAKFNQKRIRGKNQYTKDRDENEESPARSVSRDIQRTVEESQPKSPSSDTRQGSKAKATATSKMTMLDMKRRVAAIMEFISRTQLDLAAEAAYQMSSSSGEATPHNIPTDDESNAKKHAGVLGETAEGSVTEKEFRNLTCVEMMDVLTRDMVKWQNHYT